MSESPVLSRDALDLYRDERWHRRPELRVSDDASATRFIEEVCCCLAFGGYPVGVPTLWVAACGERAPVFPEHSHSDPAVGLVWQAKDTLVQAGVAYYGRLFLRKPSFVARAWLPTMIAAHPTPELSPQAQSVVSALRETGPIPTDELGARTGLTNRKALNDALNEAQAALAVVKVEERYDPFSYIWGTFDHLFSSDMQAAEEVPPEVARRKLVRLWVNLLGVVPVRKLATILNWPLALVEEGIRPLVAAGSVLPDVRIEGQPGKALADAEVYERLRSA